MRGRIQLAAAILMAAAIPAAGQYLPSYPNTPSTPAQNPVVTSPALPVTTQAPAVQAPTTIPGQIAKTTAQLATASPDVDRLLAFHESDVKFDVVQLRTCTACSCLATGCNDCTIVPGNGALGRFQNSLNIPG